MESTGIAVIGTGFMGTIHARTYMGMPDAELVGITDLDPGRARDLAKELGVAAFSSTSELLADSRVRAVSICTNDEGHLEPALAALAAGKHVLLEKPIATTLPDADAIVEASEAAEGHLLAGHTLRFENRYARAHKEIRDGSIGEVVSIFARRVGSAATQEALRGRVSVLSFLGVHDFDICRWLADSPAQSVYTQERRGLLSSRGFDVEDQTFTLIRFQNGSIACVEAGWILPQSHPRRADFCLEVLGTEGVVNLDLASSGISVCRSDGYRWPDFGHGIENELSHFLRCVRGEQTPGATAAEARNALEISLAAQLSAQTGRPVELPLDGDE